jgi:hypothetical protein
MIRQIKVRSCLKDLVTVIGHLSTGMLMVAAGIARGPDAPKNVVRRPRVFMPGGCDRRFLQQSEAQILADDCCWMSSRETNAKRCVGSGPSGKLDGR